MAKEKVVARKEDSDHYVLEETGTAFDPTVQYLDLSKEEKLRTTALLMAIQAYDHLIIKDAEMYREIRRDTEHDQGPKIQPATMDAMVLAAMQFEDFIAGRLRQIRAEVPRIDETSTGSAENAPKGE